MPSGELTRSKSDRMIAGVCGGLARWLGLGLDRGADSLRADFDFLGRLSGDDRLHHPGAGDAVGRVA